MTREQLLERLGEQAGEIERLRAALAELAARKQGEYDCAVCGRPCYESDLAADAYLCARCGPHPAEDEVARLRSALEAYGDATDAEIAGLREQVMTAWRHLDHVLDAADAVMATPTAADAIGRRSRLGSAVDAAVEFFNHVMR